MPVRKKHCSVIILNYLQNNGASNYDHDLLVKKIQEIILNWIKLQNN